MRTVDEIITDIKELSPEKQRLVISAFISDNYDLEDNFEPTTLSPEDMALLDKCDEESQKGIGISGPFTTSEEISSHLDSL